jgi:hypothetical protein
MTQEPFETFKWKGQTRYKCGGMWESGAPCQFDTHDKNAIIAHMSAPHIRDPTRAVVLANAPPPPPPSALGTEESAAEFAHVRFADASHKEHTSVP